MPLRSGYSRATIEANIAMLIREGKPRDQAIAVALNEARISYRKKHPNGFPPDHLATPEERERRRSFRGKNPVPPSKRVQLRDAIDLYENFTGHDGEVIGKVEKPVIPDALLCVGEIDGILYSTIRDGIPEKYIHEFAKKSRPLFCVTPDGTQIVLLGGGYDFTERGIVDRTGRKR